ncbi:MAG: signal recognition particle-docking protein FtsY, partial [Actinomycetota bacterium]
MDNAPLILLLLVGLVVVFGLGVVALNRRKAGNRVAVPSPPLPTIEKPPTVAEPVPAEPATPPEIAEPEPEPVAPRRRFAKAAGIFTGAFAGVRAK